MKRALLACVLVVGGLVAGGCSRGQEAPPADTIPPPLAVLRIIFP